MEVTVSINVARSEEEAERQARGEDVTLLGEADEEEEVIAVEEVFEDEELAREVQEELEEGEEASAEADAQAPTDSDGGDGEADAAGEEAAPESEDDKKND